MDDKEFDSINVIPLVDIMLVLLTIVLTTSTLIAAGAIPLSLPQATRQHDPQRGIRVIEIDKSGGVFLDAVPVCLNKLKDELNRADKNEPVLIRADKRLVLQQFVDVLDAVKQLGFGRVSLQTESL
jgi:biopolymer transport protein ExbD